MTARITSHWWLFLIRGILALALGLAFPWFPGAAIFTLAILFGAYCFADGVVAIVVAVRMQHADSAWGWLIVEGILGIVVGLITFFYPAVTILWLAYLLGAWALITGLLSIGSAIRLRRVVQHEWWWLLGGALSVVFGLVVFAAPIYGLLVIVWMVSIYALLAGIFFIGLAFRLRGHAGGAGDTASST
ncbi:MAG: HdeD family acid-resistance protein [Vulcanimicrobiaceae bacterium]|jgi:uncharacterized membrane protein HdeD (DUF308 family)